MRRSLAVLVFFALSACEKKSDPPPNPPDQPDPVEPATPPDTPKEGPHVDEREISRDPKVYDQFCELMEQIGAAHKSLKKDVRAKKEEAALKAHLKTILEAGRKARALKYLKDEAKNEELDTYFDIFDLKINQFLEDDWEEDKAEGNFERLGSTCRTCHELWRD